MGRPIVIAGAGIGGLAAAIALARAGRQVVVLERALALEETGAGVQLAANAMRCLRHIGVLPRLVDTAVVPDAFEILNGRSGRVLAHAPLGREAQKRFGGPFAVMHRADLQSALLDAARAERAITLRLGRNVEDFASDADGVAVQATCQGQPETHEGAVLVGADGLRSAVRQRLGFAPQGPVFRRRAAWRATVPASALPETLAAPVVRLWLGPEAHLVAYPVRGGELVNIVAVTADTRPAPGWGAGAAPGELVTVFARWCDDARRLIDAPKDWLRWSLYDIEPLKRWGQGPVTLLGDAAHAMLPFLAQGAAQALEDAVTLAGILAEARDELVPALRVYEQRRQSRAARVQKAARQADKIYHQRGPARLARDLTLRARPGAAAMERYGWIYRWGP